MKIPGLSQADQDFRDQVIEQNVISERDLSRVMTAREQDWDLACRKFDGIYLHFQQDHLIIEDFSSGEQHAEISLQNTGMALLQNTSIALVSPDSGRLEEVAELSVSKTGLLLAKDMSCLAYKQVLRQALLPETHHFIGHPDHDLHLSPRHDCVLVTERYAGRLLVISLKNYQVEKSFQIREPGSCKSILASFSPKGDKVYLSDQESDRLWHLELKSLELRSFATGFGTLGNLCVGPDPDFMYLSVVSPIFQLLYLKIEDLDIIKEIPLEGYPLSLRGEMASDPLFLTGNESFLLVQTAIQHEGQDRSLIQMLSTADVQLRGRYLLEHAEPVGMIAEARVNPLHAFRAKKFEDWLVQLKILSAQNLLMLKQGRSISELLQHEEHYEVPQGDENPLELMERLAPEIQLPAEADDILVDFMVQSFFMETGLNLRDHASVMKRLKAEAEMPRLELEQRYAAVIEIEEVMGKVLQTIVTRESLLQELDASLGGDDVPFKPKHRCPMCHIPLQAPRFCQHCGFQLDDPAWGERRERQSVESSSALIPGQMLLSLPHAQQVVLLNPWHQVMQEWKGGEQSFAVPAAAVALPDRNILVADSKQGKIIELRADGGVAELWPEKFQHPCCVSFYRHKGQLRFLVVDSQAQLIQEFDENHICTRKFGPSEGLALQEPRDIQRSWNETFLISDVGLKQVIEVEPSGQILEVWGAEEELQRPILARRQLNGETLVVDAGKCEVLIFGKEKRIVRRFNYWPPPEQPSYLARQTSPEHFLVLHQGDLLALGRKYWMQLNPTFKRIRWIKPWTGERRPQRLKNYLEERAKEGPVLKQLRKIDFLREAESEHLQLLADHLDPVRFEAGQMLARDGEMGNAMFFIQQGEVQVLREGQEKPVLKLKAPQVVGATSLILGEARMVNIKAASDCEVLQLERSDYKKVVLKFAALAKSLRELARDRKAMYQNFQSHQQQDAVRKVKAQMAVKRMTELGFFQDPPEGMLEEIALAMTTQGAMPAQTVFSQGESGDTLYFISRGQVSIYLDEHPEAVAQLDAGAIFGEMSVLTDEPRSATVKTEAYCQFFTLDRTTLDAIAAKYPGVQEHLETLAQKRKSQNETLRSEREAAELLAQEETEADPLFDDFLGAEAETDPDLTTTAAWDKNTMIEHGMVSICAQTFCVDAHPRPLIAFGLNSRGDSLISFNHQGQLLWHAGAAHGVKLSQASRLQHDGQYMWVADTGNHRVLAMQSREIVLEMGPPDYDLHSPRAAVPTPDGHFLVCDEGNQRILLVSQAGDILWNYASPHDILSPYYAEWTAQNTVLFADRAMHMVFEVNPETNAVVWSYGQMMIAGSQDEQLNEPSCVRRFANGGTLILDTGNNRLLLVSPVGTLMRVLRGAPDMPLERPFHMEELSNGENLIFSEDRALIVRFGLSGQPNWAARLVV